MDFLCVDIPNMGHYTKDKKLPKLGKVVRHQLKKGTASNLKRLRENKKLTQEQMAELLGYSVPGYRKIEQGTRGLPIHKAMIAKDILNCSLDEIFLPSNMPKWVCNECGE